MTYLEKLELAKKDLSPDKIAKAREIQERVIRYQKQCKAMEARRNMISVPKGLASTEIFNLLNKKVPKPAHFNVFNINNISRHNLPDRLLAERSSKS